jgi:hypothetical protein
LEILLSVENGFKKAAEAAREAGPGLGHLAETLAAGIGE